MGVYDGWNSRDTQHNASLNTRLPVDEAVDRHFFAGRHQQANSDRLNDPNRFDTLKDALKSFPVVVPAFPNLDLLHGYQMDFRDHNTSSSRTRSAMP
jgi:hypothetical protein